MPKAVSWYRVYCYLFAAVNFGMFVFAVWTALSSEKLPHDYMSAQTYFWISVFLMPLNLGMSLGNLWLAHAKGLKDPWALQLTNMAVGLGVCVMVPIALPLLVMWFQPSVRQYYGKVTRP